MQSFVSTNTQNKDVQRLEDSIENVFNSIQLNPLLKDPKIIQNVTFVNGVDLIVNHTLNRIVKGYIVIKSNAAVSVFTSSTVNANPLSFLIMKSNANATVDLLFF